MSKHTPISLPLTGDFRGDMPDDVDVLDADGKIIACEMGTAQAEYLIAAVNSHDELVKALEEAESALVSATTLYGGSFMNALGSVRAALSKARAT